MEIIFYLLIVSWIIGFLAKKSNVINDPIEKYTTKEDLFAGMEPFTEEEIRESVFRSAKKYKTISDMRKAHAYDIVVQFGLEDEVKKIIKHEVWSDEVYADIAKKYQNRSSFRRREGYIYWQAEQKGIIDKICIHMPDPITGFNPKIPGILYYLKINQGQAYKIGITNLSVNERFQKSDLAKIEIIKIMKYEMGADARAAESEILYKYREFKYKGEKLLTSGNTELFHTDVLKLDENSNSTPTS